ncbi:MAG: hypothetical protein Kow0083_05950 [Methylophaga sp.]
MRIDGDVRIEYGVRNLIGDFVGVALGDGFRGKGIETHLCSSSPDVTESEQHGVEESTNTDLAEFVYRSQVVD